MIKKCKKKSEIKKKNNWKGTGKKDGTPPQLPVAHAGTRRNSILGHITSGIPSSGHVTSGRSTRMDPPQMGFCPCHAYTTFVVNSKRLSRQPRYEQKIMEYHVK